MKRDQIEFGSRLKKERDLRSLSLQEIAKITKIPSRSLERLEAGEFDKLPGDVFVRGFLRSYARCVGLDPEATVREYGSLLEAVSAVDVPVEAAPAPRALPEATPSDTALVIASSAAAPTATSSSSSSSSSILASATPPSKSAPAAPEFRFDSPTQQVSLLAETLAEARQGTHRASLTLAVIILVVVATLTLSFLLRRPSHTGDGVSTAPTALVSSRA